MPWIETCSLERSWELKWKLYAPFLCLGVTEWGNCGRRVGQAGPGPVLPPPHYYHHHQEKPWWPLSFSLMAQKSLQDWPGRLPALFLVTLSKFHNHTELYFLHAELWSPRTSYFQCKEGIYIWWGNARHWVWSSSSWVYKFGSVIWITRMLELSFGVIFWL